MDATTISVPILTVVSCVGSVCTVLAWAYTTFDRKDDAKTRHTDLQERVLTQDKLLREIANDVSFIRGKLEK